MSLFDNELYPTPPEIIAKMLEAYIRSYQSQRWDTEEFYLTGSPKNILDPSGGTGAILEYLEEEHLKNHRKKLYTVEIDPELRLILQGKGFKVIGTDFLEYDEPMTFDLIIMNPPFSNGWKHVLKAWEVLAPGGRMTSLLNAETLRNPDTKDKANLLNLLGSFIDRSFRYGDDPAPLLLALEESKSVEWLGACFAGAARATLAEVVMVRLQKPVKPVSFTIDGDSFDKDAPLDGEAYTANPLAHADALKNLVVRYETARKILLQRHEAQSKLDFFLDGISSPVMSSIGRDETESFRQEVGLNDQIACLKSRFWSTVFDKTQIGSKVTSGYRKKFDDIAIHQTNMAFSLKNVQELLLGFFANRGEIMQECVADVFDAATKYHKDNQLHNEGWKTNSGYRLGKRIIMPNGVRHEYGSFNRCYGYREDFMEDLDKVMCYLSGCDYSNIKSLRSALHEALDRPDWQQQFESSFFKFRFYKKGTLHIDFIDMELLEDFNVIACQFKKWLPADFGYTTRRERQAAAPPPEPAPVEPQILALPAAAITPPTGDDAATDPTPLMVPAWVEANGQTALLEPKRVEKSGQMALF